MTEGYCMACGAALVPGSDSCQACGEHAGSVLPSVSTGAVDPEGRTILADDGEFSYGVPESLSPVPSVAEPLPTIIEEPEPEPTAIRLEISDVETGSRTVEFDLREGEAFAVGRDGRVTQYVPDDPRSSRRHFSIALAPEGLYVADLGSSNGTYVNGVKIEGSTWVKDGDAIGYGRSKAVLRVEQP